MLQSEHYAPLFPPQLRKVRRKRNSGKLLLRRFGWSLGVPTTHAYKLILSRFILTPLRLRFKEFCNLSPLRKYSILNYQTIHSKYKPIMTLTYRSGCGPVAQSRIQALNHQKGKIKNANKIIPIVVIISFAILLRFSSFFAS